MHSRNAQRVGGRSWTAGQWSVTVISWLFWRKLVKLVPPDIRFL